MQFIKFKNQTERGNLLSKVDTLGSFDFYTSLVSLEALSAQDLHSMQRAFHEASFVDTVRQGKLTPDQYIWAAKILPLAAHEYAHFIDATSTLWGFRHLGLMNEAYLSSDKSGVPESQFSKAKCFYDHCRRIRLPSYYTVVNDGVQNIRPWQSNISVGHLFSSDGSLTDKSILFSRFSNYQGEFLARSPVSMVSLLEASAMAQELMLQSILIQITEPNFRLIEKSHFFQKTIDYIYNPEITEYSVCAHIVANQQHCSDVLAAYQLCAIIIRSLLNFPEQTIIWLADNCPIGDLLKISEDSSFVKAIRNGLKNGDLGILYYLVCISLPEQSHVSKQAAIDGVVEAFKNLGIDFGVLHTQAKARASELCVNILNTAIQPISQIARAGQENFFRISESDPMLNFSNLNLPPVLLGDSSISHVFGSDSNLLKDFDFDACFDELATGQSWVERFAEACV
jgi:hypothetical protein